MRVPLTVQKMSTISSTLAALSARVTPAVKKTAKIGQTFIRNKAAELSHTPTPDQVR